MSRTWKDKRLETLRARLPNGKVQYLLVERDSVKNVVKILDRKLIAVFMNKEKEEEIRLTL